MFFLYKKHRVSSTHKKQLAKLKPCILKMFSLLYNGYRVFSGVKERPERDDDSSPPSSAVVMKR
jgi:hypothetical protein